MKLFNRILISIKRQWVKTMLAFSLVFLLATLMAGAISIRRAIINADENLRRQLPAMATIRQDQEAISQAFNEGLELRFESVSGHLIREIGSLPYVNSFDYSTWGFSFFGDDLVRVFDSEMFVAINVPMESIRDHDSLRAQGLNSERFMLKGIHHPYVMDVEAGLIQLIDGRTFTLEEVENGSSVVLVSHDFMESNDFIIGDIIELDYRIYHVEGGVSVAQEEFSSENLLNSTSFELEIIGVFIHEITYDRELEPWMIREHFEISNRFYVPNRVIESTIDLYLETFSEGDEIIEDFLMIDDLEEVIQYENIVFLLHDPLYLLGFHRAALNLLPDFWMVSDLSNAYAPMATAMETVRDMANGLLIGSIIATSVTLTLLILMLLQERKQEIGVYLALGERKVKLYVQNTLEILLISMVAVTLALGVGYFLADQISSEMMARELSNQMMQEHEGFYGSDSLEAMGFRIEMTEEEMIEAYRVHLTFEVVLTFYLMVVGTIMIATTMPMLYLLKMNPKNILLKSNIG
ncbi:MAG: FtsX-like permease family protein [Turicibacter sp.]|nr:FtsX-like permease family protein [Turicibacter sp.]